MASPCSCWVAIDFVARLDSGGDPVVEAGLPEAVRVVHAYRTLADLSIVLTELETAVPGTTPPEAGSFENTVLALLRQPPEDDGNGGIDQTEAALEASYQQAKSALLVAGRRGEVPATQLVRLLNRISMLRRMARQAFAGARGRHALALDGPEVVA